MYSKTKCIIIFCFFFSFTSITNAWGQKRREYPILSPDERHFLTKRSADSLIKLGQYYLVYENACDYRDCICNDSITQVYHFKIRYFDHGCVVINNSERIAIKKFNVYMTRALDSVNCPGWKNLFTNQQYNCSKNLCMPKNAEDTLITYKFLGTLCLLFNHQSAIIDTRLFCVLDHTIVKTMKKYPDIKVTISGFAAKNENDTHGTLAQKRAQNVAFYLQSQGISAKRIITKKEIDTDKYMLERPIRESRKVYFTFQP